MVGGLVDGLERRKDPTRVLQRVFEMDWSSV